jgi:hypothetical protein
MRRKPVTRDEVRIGYWHEIESVRVGSELYMVEAIEHLWLGPPLDIHGGPFFDELGDLRLPATLEVCLASLLSIDSADRAGPVSAPGYFELSES